MPSSTETRREKGTGSYSYRSDGRWLGVIRRRGHRHYVSVYGPNDRPTENKIKAALRDLARDLDEGRTGGRQNVAQFLERWLTEVVEPNRRASTARGYRSYVEKHLVPELGGVPLRELNVEDVQSAMNAIGRHKTARGKRTLTPRSVQQCRAVLRVALNQAIAWRLVTTNAAEAVSIKPVRRPKDVMRALTPDQASDFLEALSGERLEALYILAVAIGLRQGELLGLRWSDVDLETGRVTVRQTVDRSHGAFTFQAPKTEDSARSVRLPEVALDSLRAHRKRQLAERVQAGKHWKKHDLVFTLPDGDPLIGSTVTYHLQRFLKAHKLPIIRFHDLRHSCASLLISQGASLKDVMETLGHSQISLTANLYGHLYDERLAEIAGMMDKALRKNG